MYFFPKKDAGFALQERTRKAVTLDYVKIMKTGFERKQNKKKEQNYLYKTYAKKES